jgi:plasmid replication initiation protein
MGKTRKLNTNDNIRVVTSNSFITALELSKMSLKARKLLYIAIAQCEKNDDEFYEYKLTVPEFADLMGIDKSNLYQEADNLTDELVKSIIRVKQKGSKNFDKYPLTSRCEYKDNSYLRIELNPRMTDLLLQLKGDFTQALLSDFLRMRSPYSMAIWHLMQREMKSKKPGSRRIDFYLSLDELRQVTGTENKLKQIGQFKERVLDKALREIQENCGTVITYKNRKQGRTIVGFDFCAINEFGIDMTDYKPTAEVLEKGRLIELKRISKERI